MTERLRSFSLSTKESKGVDLAEEDIKAGVEEGRRSLVGRVYGDKKANFLGIKSTFMKLWHHKGTECWLWDTTCFSSSLLGPLTGMLFYWENHGFLTINF